MKSKLWLNFSIGAALLGSGHAVGVSAEAAAGGQLSFYDQTELTARQQRSGPKLTRLFEQTLLSAVPAKYRGEGKNVRLEFPLPTEGRIDDPMGAFSNPQTQRIHIPAHTIQFFDDLCIAMAWLEESKQTSERLLKYLAMLKYRRPGDLGLSRFPAPRQALAIPADALNSANVATQVDKMYGSAFAWILSHELAHIVMQHQGYETISASEARVQEEQADEFANEVMKSLGVPPIGLVVYLQARTVLDVNQHDFENDAAWTTFVRKSMTHPLSGQRIRAIGGFIRTHGSEFIRKERLIDVRGITELGSKISALGELLDDRDIQLKFRRLGMTANSTSLRAGEKSPAEAPSPP